MCSALQNLKNMRRARSRICLMSMCGRLFATKLRVIRDGHNLYCVNYAKTSPSVDTGSTGHRLHGWW